jgi:hypothetical protein
MKAGVWQGATTMLRRHDYVDHLVQRALAEFDRLPAGVIPVEQDGFRGLLVFGKGEPGKNPCERPDVFGLLLAMTVADWEVEYYGRVEGKGWGVLTEMPAKALDSSASSRARKDLEQMVERQWPEAAKADRHQREWIQVRVLGELPPTHLLHD